MSASLFPGAGASGSRKLVEFIAGKMIMEGNTVRPDTRKGLVYVHQGDDTLMHFCWKDRTTNTVEDDLIMFPESIEFEKINKSNGRVYILRFRGSDKKMFFWMQSKKADKDEENCRKVNFVINNPPIPGVPYDMSAALANASGSEDVAMELDEPAGVETHHGIDVVAQPPAGPPTMGENPAPVPEPDPRGVDLRDLVRMWNERQAGGHHQSDVDLSAVLTPEAIVPLLANPEARERLLRHIPDNLPRSPEELRNLLHSPQFTQALHSFNAALQSGQLAPMMSQFGVDNAPPGVEAFLRALQQQASRGDRQEGGESNDNNKMDES
eukprot:Opistho-2@25946